MQPRYFIFILLLFLGLVALYLFSGKEEVVDRSQNGESIIAFGDSLVEGVGASPEHNFVSVLSQRLRTPIINAGVSGDTTETALIRFEKDVLGLNPKIVILLLGGNDGLRKLPIEDMFSRLRVMIDRTHEAGAAVLLVGVSPKIFSKEFNRKFAKLAEETKVSFVPDILKGLVGRPEYMSDPIHPSDKGYAVIADRIEPVLKKMLQK